MMGHIDSTVATNAVMACIQAAKNAAELQGHHSADEALRYAEAARSLAETMATMFHYDNQ